MSFEPNLLLGIFSFVVALVYSQTAYAREPCQQLGQGGDILTRARAERRILQNLSMLEGSAQHERSEAIEQVAERAARDDAIGRASAMTLEKTYQDDFEIEVAAVMLHRGENHEGFRLCDARGGVTRGTLERNWWGFYESVYIPEVSMPGEVRGFPSVGMSVFYLRSNDGVEFGIPGRNPSLDYVQSLGGLSFQRGWFSLSVGAFTQKYPEASDVPEELLSPSVYGDLDVGLKRERSLYLNLGIPKLGVSFDLVGLPGNRRGGVDVAQLGVGGIEIPAGMRLDATAGFLGQQDTFFGALALDEIPGGFDLEVGFEANDPYFKYARVRWKPSFRKTWLVQPEPPPPPQYYSSYSSSDSYEPYVSQLRFSPFVAASVTQDELFLPRRDSRWVYGGLLGAELRWEQDLMSMGFEAHVGRDFSDWLLVLPETSDRLTWGTSIFLYVGI
jgi:hypothetical protein